VILVAVAGAKRRGGRRVLFAVKRIGFPFIARRRHTPPSVSISAAERMLVVLNLSSSPITWNSGQPHTLGSRTY